MAVGLTVEPGKLEKLRSCMNGRIRDLFPDGLPEPTLQIDATVSTSELTADLLRELEQLAPYGQGNPEPVFSLEGVRIKSIFPMGKDHFKFSLLREGLPELEGVAWNGAHSKPPLNTWVDVAVRFHWHTWRGVKNPRLTLLDWRYSVD